MMGGTSMLAFVAASLVVLIAPGPAVLYILARSLSQGQRAGLVSVLGLSTGALVHVVAATLGVSAVLMASATAFGVVKVLGAAYLIYLGLRAILTRPEPAGSPAVTSRSMRRLFADGVVVNVLNPKIAVFFLAFLPQFVDPGRGPIPLQLLWLGMIYVGLALLTDGAYAVLAGRLRDRFGHRMAQSRWSRYASGAVYVGLGLQTALAQRR